MAETINLRETLGRAVRSAINLRVVSMVGTPTIDGELEALQVKFGAGAVQQVAVTNINLLEGDIVTCTSEAIAKGELPEIKALHDSMVAKADGIVQRNVQLIRDMIQAGFEEFTNLTEAKKKTSVG
jgi:hypothetical protein